MNCNLKRSRIKLGFSLLIVLYNSAQSALNLLIFVEDVRDSNNDSLYKISYSLHQNLTALFCQFSVFCSGLALDHSVENICIRSYSGPYRPEKTPYLDSFQAVKSKSGSLGEKCLFSELFWSVFSCIRTEYGPE